MTQFVFARTNALFAATIASLASFAFVLAIMPPAAYGSFGA
jgi:hypothetical protein